MVLPAGAGADESQGQDPNFTPSYDDYGEYGYLQTPSARPGADGDFSFTYSHVHPYDRYVVAVTPLPWLETQYMFDAITNQLYGPVSFSGNQSYKHQQPNVKIRLVQESESFPEMSLGFRDFAGTQLFGGEYLALTRRYYDFDLTAGLGWGYLANRPAFANPFTLLGKSFKVRPTGAEGQFTFGFFHGPNVGVFAGIEYHTPIEGLRLKLELDPNNYQNEPLTNVFHDPSPVNAAVVYRPNNFSEFSAGIERGNTVMLRITLSANFNHLGLFHVTSDPPQLVPRPTPPDPTGVPLDQSSLPQVAPPSAPAPAGVAPPTAAIASLPPCLAVTGDCFDRAAPPARSPSSGIDRLYSGARRLGYEIADVAMDGDKAVLAVVPTPQADGTARPKLRCLALDSLPDVNRVEIDLRPTPAMAAAQPTDAAAATTAAPAAAAAAKPLAYDEASVARRIFDELKEQGLSGQSFAIKGTRAYLAFYQGKYHVVTIGLGRVARIVARNLPPDVEQITLDVLDNGLNVVSVTVWRRDLENAVAETGSPEEIWQNATIVGADPDRPAGVFNNKLFPNFDWSANPGMRQQLGGPNGFFIYEMYLALNGSVGLAPGLSTDVELGANLFNNLNELTLQSNSLLPHVRSDIVKYLKEGKTGIFRWQSDYLFNIAPDWYGRVSGGLFEEMFAGVDGEVLYRPYDKRWAIGFDLNYLRQREYHDLFALLPYHVETGFLSFYYKLPFYHLEAALRVGRYLAGDKGATIEISRTFDSGVRAGIFATRTNVSAQQFGEGAFDKGVFLSIPLDLLFGNPTRAAANYVFRPLTRDGGQTLATDKPLYSATEGYDPSELSEMWPHLLQ